MKKFLACLAVVLLVSCFFIANTEAGDEKKGTKKVPKKENASIPDELQKEYLKKLQRINWDLQMEHNNSKSYVKLMELQLQREALEVKYRGRIPTSVLKEKRDLENEIEKIAARRTALEKEKENLKLDALKHYNGKMPEWLSNKWAEEESNFSVNMNK